MKKFLKVLGISFICFVLVMLSSTYIFEKSINVGTENVENMDSKNILKDTDRVNVLIVGVDAMDPKNSNGARTDTMMLATFDPVTMEVGIISIPRDTRTVIRGRSGKDKINHAYAYGGIDLTMKAVKDLLGIDVPYYVKIDYKALEKVVDDLGGVDINVPIDMKYSDPYADPPLKINLKKGMQRLDGEKAMQFVRFRKGYANQDLGRINAQHDFLMALVDKILSPQIIIKLPKLINTFYTYVDTNMSLPTITSYAMKGRKIDFNHIKMYTIPGEPKLMSGVWYYIPDMEKTEEIIKNLLSGKNENREGLNKNPVGQKDENEVTIEVLNGSGVGGLATKASKMLQDEGYNVVNISNIKGMTYSQTHIYDRKNKEKEATKVAKLLGVSKVEKDIHSEAKTDITVIVGSSIKDIGKN